VGKNIIQPGVVKNPYPLRKTDRKQMQRKNSHLSAARDRKRPRDICHRNQNKRKKGRGDGKNLRGRRLQRAGAKKTTSPSPLVQSLPKPTEQDSRQGAGSNHSGWSVNRNYKVKSLYFKENRTVLPKNKSRAGTNCKRERTAVGKRETLHLKKTGC